MENHNPYVPGEATVASPPRQFTGEIASKGRRFGILPVDKVACPPKWTAVPSRIPERAQGAVHSILGYLPARRLNSGFGYRHFRELSDSWKYARGGRLAFDPATHETDTVLQRELSLVDWKR